MTKPLILLVTLVALLLAGAPPVAADEPPVPPPPAPKYSPRTGVLFNNPEGTPEEEMALMDHVTNSIASVPPGAIIRIAVYSFSYLPMADALIAAKKRGVQVKLLIDSHTTTPEIVKLRRALGTNRKNRSYVATCRFGCMSSKPSFMHAKLYLFSTSGSSKKVSMIASANPTWSGGTKSWNNLVTLVGDPAIYESNLRYFYDMLKDRTNTRYYRTVSSGPYKVYYFPRAGTGPTSDTLYNVLSQVRCTGAAPGTGVGGRTSIRVSAYLWTGLRLAVAKKIAELKALGCDVEIAYSADTVAASVASTLLRARVKIFNGRLDQDGDGIPDIYIHSKYLLISGVYGARSDVKVVYTGSPNLSLNSLRQSNEAMIRLESAEAYEAFRGNFDLMKQLATVPLLKAPAADPRSLERLQERGDDYQIRPDDE